MWTYLAVIRILESSVCMCVHVCVLGMLFADCDCGSSHGMIDLNLVHAVIFLIVYLFVAVIFVFSILRLSISFLFMAVFLLLMTAFFSFFNWVWLCVIITVKVSESSTYQKLHHRFFRGTATFDVYIFILPSDCLNLSSRPIFFPLDSECCACVLLHTTGFVCVCVCWKWWESCWMKCCSVFVQLVELIVLWIVHFVDLIVFVLCASRSC